MSPPVLAVDIGGTKIALALVADDGAITDQLVRATPRSADPETIFGAVAGGLQAIVEQADVAGPIRVGVGSAGPIDTRSGTISPVNIPGWRGFPIVERVQAVLTEAGRQPVVGLAGDGHCFALGEH